MFLVAMSKSLLLMRLAVTPFVMQSMNIVSLCPCILHGFSLVHVVHVCTLVTATYVRTCVYVHPADTIEVISKKFCSKVHIQHIRIL